MNKRLDQTYLKDTLIKIESKLEEITPENLDCIQLTGALLNLIRSIGADNDIERHLGDLTRVVRKIAVDFYE